MDDRRDPVAAADDDSRDLYEIATWEPRTWLDRLSVRVYGGIVHTARAIVILVALAILVAQFALTGLAAVANPIVGTFILLSVLPAFAIAAYVWRADVSMREPLGMLVTTYLLGILFAGFAAVLNTLFQPPFRAIPVVGMALFFYLIVAPIEETVKWLAVRLHAYRSEDFRTVLDGAVYGAMAGLGFATIENTIYIGRQYLQAVQMDAATGGVGAAVGIAAVRSFAGPGHVLYSAIAGYYLGLAKFNPDDAGPIVVKGLLIAAFVHATYNTLVGPVPGLVHALQPGIPIAGAFIGFVIVYDGLIGYALYRKISRYREAYLGTDARAHEDGGADAGTDGGTEPAESKGRIDDDPDGEFARGGDDWEWGPD